MVAKFKNILYLIIIIVTVIYISSCTVILPETVVEKDYEITYIYNNQIIDHTPSKYNSSKPTNLVDLDVEGFVGWYTSPTFTGEKVTEIKLGTTGNLTFYAKIIKEDVPIIDEYNLEKIINNMTNYAYTYTYVSDDGNDSYVSYNEYNLGNILQSGYDYYDEYYEDYLVTVDGVRYIYTKDYDGVYVKIEEDDIYFDSYYSLFDIVKFDELDHNLFEYVDGSFKLINENDINNVGKLLLGDFEGDTYTDLEIFVNDLYVTKIVATSKYLYDGYYYNYQYEVIFSNHLNVNFDIPNVDKPISSTQTIEEVYLASDDTTVITKGYVNGIIGNNIYIQDSTGGVYLYLGNNSSYASSLNFGDEIIVEGIKTTYKGLVEIEDITSIELTSNKANFKVDTLESLDETLISLYVSELVDFNNLTITSIPDNYSSSTEDVKIEVTDGVNIINLFISKHLDAYDKNNIFKDSLSINNKININNALISYFNSYQIVVSSYSSIEIVNSSISSELKKAPSNTKRLEDVLPYLGEENGEVYGVSKGLPSKGNPQVLVIPIAFTNYPAPSNIQNVLETAFFGTSSQTGWESLSSYYYKSSYGELNIKGTVLPAYNTGKSSTYYEYIEEGDYLFIKDALEYYDGIIDYSDYDYDNDGYIDSLYFVYTCPYNDVDEDSLYWAYTYEYYTDEYEYYDNVEADFYILASYEFIFDKLANGSKVTYNMETFIHETGHLLGLDDYYDYDDSVGPDGGIGGGDMMDYNVGDHNPFTKIILGWTTPYLVTSSTSKITLNSFGDSGDVIMIPKSFNNTYFDEYYLIDFYTPDGLNELEGGYNGLFDVSGIRIYHVDATLKDPKDAWTVWDIYKYNNTDTSHKLIKLIEADNNNHIENNNYGYSEDTDLFQEGMSYSNSKWYNGLSTNFTINIINIYKDSAEIEIIFN